MRRLKWYGSLLPSISQLAELIRTSAAEAGFDLVGIAPAGAAPELEYFQQWIAEGRHGDMKYMESRDEQGRLKRESVQNAAPWAKSVVVCAMNYNTAQPYSTEGGDASRGWISRYAWGQHDYHDVILPRLREIEARLRESAGDIQTWCYVDTGPVVERVLARYAGIGWIGKNACIINQQLGSWLFLGVILTSLELQPDLPAPDRCGTCTRCLHACPTEAFIGPGKVDATRCISYLTIEKRGSIPEELRAGMGRHVFGCDICQDVCPWNNRGGMGVPATSTPDFQPRPYLVNPDLEWLANISETDFREAFRGSPIKRAKRSGIRRNAVIAMGNSGDPKFLDSLRTIAERDPDEMVAEHARWAIRRLQGLRSTTRPQCTGATYSAE